MACPSHMFKVRSLYSLLEGGITRSDHLPDWVNRDERPLGPFSLHDAVPARGIRVFLQLYRERVSAICAADTGGRTSRTQGQSPTAPW